MCKKTELLKSGGTRTKTSDNKDNKVLLSTDNNDRWLSYEERLLTLLQPRHLADFVDTCIERAPEATLTIDLRALMLA